MADKKVIIRVDGNYNIGLGHIYRGIALAEILKEKFVIEFVSRDDTTISPLQESGFDYSFIPDKVKFVDEPNWIKENYSRETIIVLDGYEFNQKYQQKIKDLNYKLVYIDDLARGLQMADLVINHSPGVKEGDYKTSEYTKLALGLNYALIRKSFIGFNRNKAKHNSKIKNIFISFGGADKHDFSLKATQEVLKLDFIQSINVVLGAAYKNKIIFDLNTSKLKIHQNISEHEVFKLMNKSDLAIVPASTTSIELASLGVPMILGYFVDNQKRIYNGFLDKLAVTGIEDFNEFDFKNINSIINSLNDSEKLKEQSLKLLNLFEERPDKNILKMFQFDKIFLRKALESDMKFVFDLSNDLLVRSNSYHSNNIEFNQHKNWFNEQIKDKNILFYIVESNNIPIGQVRFMLKENHAVIGISIISDFRGKGLSSMILNESVKEYSQENKKPIYAYIKKTNLPSVKSFKKVGFICFKEEIINESESYIYKKVIK